MFLLLRGWKGVLIFPFEIVQNIGSVGCAPSSALSFIQLAMACVLSGISVAQPCRPPLSLLIRTDVIPSFLSYRSLGVMAKASDIRRPEQYRNATRAAVRIPVMVWLSLAVSISPLSSYGSRISMLFLVPMSYVSAGGVFNFSPFCSRRG